MKQQQAIQAQKDHTIIENGESLSIDAATAAHLVGCGMIYDQGDDPAAKLFHLVDGRSFPDIEKEIAGFNEGQQPSSRAPVWFVGVLRERNGEKEYTHKVLLHVCGSPDVLLRDIARSFYDDCGDPDGDGFYHECGAIFVAPASLSPVDTTNAAVLEDLLSVHLDEGAKAWISQSVESLQPSQAESANSGTLDLSGLDAELLLGELRSRGFVVSSWGPDDVTGTLEDDDATEDLTETQFARLESMLFEKAAEGLDDILANRGNDHIDTIWLLQKESLIAAAVAQDVDACASASAL